MQIDRVERASGSRSSGGQWAARSGVGGRAAHRPGDARDRARDRRDVPARTTAIAASATVSRWPAAPPTSSARAADARRRVSRTTARRPVRRARRSDPARPARAPDPRRAAHGHPARRRVGGQPPGDRQAPPGADWRSTSSSPSGADARCAIERRRNRSPRSSTGCAAPARRGTGAASACAGASRADREVLGEERHRLRPRRAGRRLVVEHRRLVVEGVAGDLDVERRTWARPAIAAATGSTASPGIDGSRLPKWNSVGQLTVVEPSSIDGDAGSVVADADASARQRIAAPNASVPPRQKPITPGVPPTSGSAARCSRTAAAVVDRLARGRARPAVAIDAAMPASSASAVPTGRDAPEQVGGGDDVAGGGRAGRRPCARASPIPKIAGISSERRDHAPLAGEPHVDVHLPVRQSQRQSIDALCAHGARP